MCDEQWPVCTPCMKSGRDCPGPPDRYKFMKSRRKFQKEKSVSGSPNDDQGNSITSPNEPIDETSASSNGIIVKVSSGHLSWNYTDVQIKKPKSVSLARGSPQVVTSSMPMLMSMTRSEMLACDLIGALSMDAIDISSKTFCFSHLFNELPRYLGVSPALDAATECISASVKGCLSGDDAYYGNFISRKYGKALQLLREAIKDPDQRYSDYTLAAIMIIWRNEGFFMDNPYWLWTSGHMQAIYDLIKIRGCGNLDNTFSFLLLLDCQTGIIGHSIYTGQPCFMDSPDWQVALSPRNGRSDISMLYYSVHRETTRWGSLLKSIATIRDTPDPGACPDLPSALNRAIQISQTLRFIDSRIEDLIKETTTIQPSETGDELVPLVYHFKDPALVGLIAWHTTYAISINRAVQYLFSLSAQSSGNLFEAVSEDKMIFDLYQKRNLALCRRCWMCFEQVRHWKPLGCHFLLSPLRASARYADTPEMKAWIDTASRDVADYLPWRSPFSQEAIQEWCRKVCGEDVF
ncbi:hypothetical protein EJ05DRAFT_46430 [Pseudovirgaria hyperparasitica]|uniref:Zn(2)-C6 fungal-type domain-containing protein n=1 Tax=Pseudovirgaria hyperparasitica TaxID=470096 RepID=A0A6A6W3Y5_9PEZI|nr:uncharacterized protein EJ05DRAFT_46430 [Pseudovirgaria hyperparasitica]KAF2756879.1 hypothetical protein EJ05DRAFT_46430 [Pseudovirgaria hyperparasitica]